VTIGLWIVIWVTSGQFYLTIWGVRQSILPLAFGIAGLYETRSNLKRGRRMAIIGTVIGVVETIACVLSPLWY
jgi:hypothetical protein